MMLQFGHGWPDSRGRRQALLWLSDPGWLVWDDGTLDIRIVRRGVHDERAVRGQLLGWEDHADSPLGREWVEQRMCGWPPPTPNPLCIVCQGEGYLAGHDGHPVRCGCGDVL